MRALRTFFDRRGFLEVDPPVRVRAPAPEPFIDAVKVPGGYLRTSPELAMKRLLARGYDRIYCLGPSFRAGETTDRHREEFCLLEWYRRGATYEALMRDVERLLPAVGRAVLGRTRIRYHGRAIDLDRTERRLVREAFATLAGVDDADALDDRAWSETIGLKVEPHLGLRFPTLLCDYPLSQGALARECPTDPRTVERFEVYIAGLELANGWTELTDPVVQRERFAADRERRATMGKDPYPLDEEFLSELGGVGLASGIALGVDRLLMILSDATDIGAVRPLGE